MHVHMCSSCMPLYSVQVHFRDYPSGHLLQYDGDESMQTQYFMSLKVCCSRSHMQDAETLYECPVES